VVRNYFFPQIMDNPQYRDKILWAPNGFKSGVGPRSMDKVKKANERQCFAIFAGWISNTVSFGNERAIFAAEAEKCGDNLFWRSSPGFSGGYGVSLYSAMMENSLFAPCPSGNSPETIRLYDALEMGCIPISLPHPYLMSDQALAAMGPVPFPLIDSWEQLPEYLNEMKARFSRHPGEMNALQSKCATWWRDYKLHIHRKIAERCAELAPAAAGRFSLRSLARRLSPV
jgi:hypothetical protein